MRRLLLVLVFASALFGVYAQSSFTTPGTPDSGASFQEPETVSRSVTAGITEEKAKVEALFRWITNHIAYDVKQHRKKLKSATIRYRSDQELAYRMDKFKERNARKTLRTRLGICYDYALLFHVLCEKAGIRSGVIYGSARSLEGGLLTPEHAWNWVQIDTSYCVLDVTWASGYTDRRVRYFQKAFDPSYFCIPDTVYKANYFPTDSL